MSLLRYFTCICLSLGVFSVGAQETPSSGAAANLSVQDSMTNFVLSTYRADYKEPVVTFDSDSFTLPRKCTIDLEEGNGHGFSLSFLRMSIDEDKVGLEKVIWLGRIRKRASEAKLLSAQTSVATLSRLFEAISLLPSIHLTERSKGNSVVMNPDGTVRGFSAGSSWSTTSDFFVLVRVIDGQDKVILEKEYAGYRGSLHQLEYLPMLAVTDVLHKTANDMLEWKELPVEQFRKSHFTDAFNLNRAIMVKDFHWWVMEYSLEALATFGNDTALDTVKFLKENYPKPLDRQSKKIDAVLEKPDFWLTGEPKDLTSVETQ